jgi:hypothetical protein
MYGGKVPSAPDAARPFELAAIPVIVSRLLKRTGRARLQKAENRNENRAKGQGGFGNRARKSVAAL